MASRGRRRRLAARMEPEEERLRRQIRLLQGLINDHKNVHGNAPVPPPPASVSRWRNPRLPAFHSQATFGARYNQQPSQDFSSGQANATTWRKKYSLVNAPPRPALPSPTSVSPGTSWAAQSRVGREAPKPQLMLSEAKAISSTKANVCRPAGSLAGDATGSGFLQGVSGSRKEPSSSKGSPSAASWPFNAESRHNKDTCTSTLSHVPRYKSLATGGNNRPAAGQKKPFGGNKLTPSLGRTISESAITLKSEPRWCLASPEKGTGSLPIWKKPAPELSHLYSSSRHPSPAGPARFSPTRSVGRSAHSDEEASSSSGMSLPPNKSAIVLLQKSSSLPASGRSSRFKKANYTWVANPSKSPRSVKRWAVSRAPESTPKLAICGAAASPKLQPRGAHLELGAKPKKPSPHSKAAVSTSQYKWKAASAKSAPSTSASVFTWKRKEGVRPGEAPCVGASTSFQALRRVPLAHGSPRGFFGTSGFFNYRLRSWPKNTKRKGSASSPTLLLKSRYCLRKRHATRGRSSPTARRTGTKGLVQIGKHRLRRLPASRVPGSPKEGPSFVLVTSPAAHRVVNTRYRLVKKLAGPPVTPAASSASPAHGWKARRLSSSRSLTSNSTRHSSPGSRSQAGQQHRWRNKGLRCIGGVMYRVSANKLSKTSSSPGRSVEAATRSHTRGASRPDSAPGTPGYPSPGWPSRSITSRYIASRAVQRSLAIIRQAKLRKERKKEYCMYYNRFGKCNRGESCPYIHDPEKVAVCTRFLRGACKKTDGTCPFAHKISKDKMPVCSYFLKGICSNNDCPYSHVYVSRKAEVCSDFLKGYCPLGEKCKKKHTLVCPDFSKHGVCPKGSRCKLQHPQKKHLAKQAGTSNSCPPEQGNYAKQTWRQKEEEGATGGAFWYPRILSQNSRLTKQPSFISLQSPPTSPQEEGPKSERNGEEAVLSCCLWNIRQSWESNQGPMRI
ncbi:zinc finger CCCH domain-containing protein 3 [Ahaetulla prasina]|uniref:zinc finger CCCH domain-containing protein 3 n=1 Tax=Ahaetulla prasina TaxID=499056 RepID=UPI0026493CD6|nr:zinc finger CCCH domain-containing protein 3 [Ahaetulla prasina]